MQVNLIPRGQQQRIIAAARTIREDNFLPVNTLQPRAHPDPALTDKRQRAHVNQRNTPVFNHLRDWAFTGLSQPVTGVIPQLEP